MTLLQNVALLSVPGGLCDLNDLRQGLPEGYAAH